jgi:3-methyladenine DNA glycosylase AlkD
MSSRTAEEVVATLRSLSDPKAVEGAARFGIDVPDILGVSAPALRKLAKETGADHRLAGPL